MLNGSFDLLGIELKGEDCVVCSCWLNGIPLIVGMKGWAAVTMALGVGAGVVVVRVVVVVGVVVVVVGVVVVIVVDTVVVVGFLVVVVSWFSLGGVQQCADSRHHCCCCVWGA